MLLLLSACKVQDGTSSSNDCVDPSGCYEEYLGCDESRESLSLDQIIFNISNNAANAYFAQSFKLSSSEKIHSFTIALQRANNPQGQVYMQLRADCNGDPCDSSMARSRAIDMNNLSDTAANNVITFSFSDHPEMKADTTYWAVLYMPLKGQATPVIYQKTDNSNPYADGTFKYTSDTVSTWFTTYSGHDAYLLVNTCF